MPGPDLSQTRFRGGAAWPESLANGRRRVNGTDAPATCLAVGIGTPTETADNSDMDRMVKADRNGSFFTRKDGSPRTADQIGDDND